jgi:hypothetical protein
VYCLPFAVSHFTITLVHSIMNYTNVFEAAMALFPKRIKVTCIDGVTGQQIGKYKIGLNQLPALFDKPVTLTIEGNTWRVIKANPVSSDDFSILKKLTLHVLNDEQLQQAPLGHNIPTRHASTPLTITTPFYEQCTLDITADDWLQLEFLPAAALPLIQEEMALIDPILLAKDGSNLLLGYETMHIRSQTAHLGVDIPFDAFCAAVQVGKKGNIRFGGDGFVENGFVVQTDNYEYYGTVVNNQITHLCLTSFDCIDDEFSQITTTWDLALVNWRQCSITAV